MARQRRSSAASDASGSTVKDQVSLIGRRMFIVLTSTLGTREHVRLSGQDNITRAKWEREVRQ
jgi:hypothetical protein